MHQTNELPNGNFPTFRYEDGQVQMRIGETSTGAVWNLKKNDGLTLKKHGSFKTVAMLDDRAYVRVHVPRKGWNGVGSAYSFTCMVPKDGAVTVCRGKYFQHQQ